MPAKRCYRYNNNYKFLQFTDNHLFTFIIVFMIKIDSLNDLNLNHGRFLQQTSYAANL